MDTLVLNAYYQPIDQISWQRAVSKMVTEKIEVLEYYADRVVHTISQAFQIPSVIRILSVVKGKKGVRFSRENVFKRDKGTCQYCHKLVAREDFTLDHVIPKSKGGTTKWENVAVCCLACNQKKSSRTPEQAGMRLLTVPVRPKSLPEQMKILGKVPKDWIAYLRDTIYWHGELETT